MSQVLQGVRVIDLTNVLSGPFCTYQLALLGARVIKIEAPEGGDLARQFGTDPELSRQMMGTGFLAQNAGKQSISIDLKSERGRSLFLELAATADVLVENFRPGVMDRLGLGYGAVAAVKPDIVYCSISGFGQDGPLRDRPAYDQIIQGLSGLMSVTGDEGSAPLRVGVPLCDTVGGLTAAFAVVAALYRRAVSGAGEHIDVSLLESTLSIMGWATTGYLITGQPPLPRGNENVTASPSGTFRTRDAPLNISANTQAQFESLCAAAGEPHIARDPRFATRSARLSHRRELKAALEEALERQPAAYWEERLAAADVPCGRILSVPEALAHPQVQGREVTSTVAVPHLDRSIRVLRSGFKLGGRAPRPATPPPALGQDTDEVLRELGYTDGDVQALRDARVLPPAQPTRGAGGPRPVPRRDGPRPDRTHAAGGER